jgi:hypothetical protein
VASPLFFIFLAAWQNNLFWRLRLLNVAVWLWLVVLLDWAVLEAFALCVGVGACIGWFFWKMPLI